MVWRLMFEVVRAEATPRSEVVRMGIRNFIFKTISISKHQLHSKERINLTKQKSNTEDLRHISNSGRCRNDESYCTQDPSFTLYVKVSRLSHADLILHFHNLVGEALRDAWTYDYGLSYVCWDETSFASPCLPIEQ